MRRVPVAGPLRWTHCLAALLLVGGLVSAALAGSRAAAKRRPGRDAILTAIQGQPFDTPPRLPREDNAIVAADLRARTLSPFSFGPRVYGSMAWSPDGRRVAVTVREGGRDAIYIGPAGGGLRRFGPPGPDPMASRADPSWSPDGRRLVYRAGLADESVPRALRFGIAVADAGGTGERMLVRDDTARSPAWSPDGKVIGYVRRVAVRSPLGKIIIAWKIVLVRPNGRGARSLRLTWGAREFAWAPDGQSLVYSTARLIVRIARNGEDDRLLVPYRKHAQLRSPVWSPDGRWIAYTAVHELSILNATYNVRLVDRHGKRRTIPFPGRTDLSHPAWRPR